MLSPRSLVDLATSGSPTRHLPSRSASAFASARVASTALSSSTAKLHVLAMPCGIGRHRRRLDEGAFDLACPEALFTASRGGLIELDARTISINIRA